MKAPRRIAVEVTPHGLGQATTLYEDSILTTGEVAYVPESVAPVIPVESEARCPVCACAPGTCHGIGLVGAARCRRDAAREARDAAQRSGQERITDDGKTESFDYPMAERVIPAELHVVGMASAVQAERERWATDLRAWIGREIASLPNYTPAAARPLHRLAAWLDEYTAKAPSNPGPAPCMGCEAWPCECGRSGTASPRCL